MPTYVYECSSCTTTFEVDQRITENPLTSCQCGSEGTVKRVMQPTAVMFKGSGFYVNDVAGSKSAAAAPAPAAEGVCNPTGPCNGPACAAKAAESAN